MIQFILHSYFSEYKHYDFVLTCAQQIFETTIYTTSFREAIYNFDEKNFDQFDKIYCHIMFEHVSIIYWLYVCFVKCLHSYQKFAVFDDNWAEWL